MESPGSPLQPHSPETPGTEAGARWEEAGTTELAAALAPGALLLRRGRPESADARALALLGLADAAGLAQAAGEITAALAGAHSGPADRGPALLAIGGRQLVAEIRQLTARTGEGEGGVTLVLLSDPPALAAAAGDLRLACHLRAVTQISPAVAHDLRAPINAMVFNLEILKETIAAGKGAEPAGRERQLRYVTVLRDELARLHGELEIFLSQTSGRGDRAETFDLREHVAELVALLVPAGRKIQVQVASSVPEEPVMIAANRWQLRQALLQVAVASLEKIAHPGRLTATLTAEASRARLTLAGPAASGSPETSFDFTLAGGSGGAAEPARLFVARSLLAAQGGAVRPAAAGGEGGFEIDLPIPAV